MENNKTLLGLQYLRGIAALMVVLFHTRSFFPEFPDWTHVGARGVDIFFVISGFIMAYTTEQSSGSYSKVDASIAFLSRRIIRVVPLYWLALLVTAWPYLTFWFSSAGSLSELFNNFSPALKTIVQDFVFFPHITIDDDEEDGIYPILIQGWTINYEMFFYLLFGISIFFHRYRIQLTSVVLIGLVILGATVQFRTVEAIFYTSPSLIEFVLGFVVYRIYLITKDTHMSRNLIIVLAVTGAVLLFRGSAVNDKYIMGVASAILVWAFIFGFQKIHSRSLKILGDASYSIYLFHAAVFVQLRKIIDYFNIPHDTAIASLAIVLAHAAIAVLVGILIYLYIEKPMLKILRPVSQRWSRQMQAGKA